MDIGTFIAGGVFALVCAGIGGVAAWVIRERYIHKPEIRRLHAGFAEERAGYRAKLDEAHSHASQAEEIVKGK